MKKFKLFLAVLLTAQLIAQTSVSMAGESNKEQIHVNERERNMLLNAVRSGLANAERVKVLLAGFNEDKKFELLTMKDETGYTPLHLAAYKGNTGVVQALLAACPEDKKYNLLTMTNTARITGFLLPSI